MKPQGSERAAYSVSRAEGREWRAKSQTFIMNYGFIDARPAPLHKCGEGALSCADDEIAR